MNPAIARAAVLSSPLVLAAVADASESPPPSPPRLSSGGRLSSTSQRTSESENLEEIAALVTRGNAPPPSAKEAKPRLTVSASGRFQDQFYHTQEASRTMGVLKSRTIVKQTQDGNRSDGAVKRKKSINVNGKDVEQFSDADIIFAGYLVKQGSFWKTWRRRYFILRRDVNVLAYYTAHDNLVKLGEIVIDADTKVEPPSDKEKAFPGRFAVEHSGRKLVLVAEDGRESAEMWAMLIKRCITARAVEAEAAIFAQRTSSGRESMRASLMQLRMSNGSQVVAPDSPKQQELQPKKRPPSAKIAGNISALLASAASDDTGRDSASASVPHLPTIPPPLENPTKIKRHSTDSRVIQAAADQSVLRRSSDIVEDDERERIVRTARLKSIDSANESARKLLNKGSSTGGTSSAPRPRRIVRSYSAGSVLSTRSTAFDDVRALHDDCGLLSSRGIRGAAGPNSSKDLRSSYAGPPGPSDAPTSSNTRSRNLSLPSFRPVPSIELSISIGCRGPPDISHMIVVISAIAPENRTEAKELGRTEVQGSLALRACGGDFYARDFSALLPVPISGGQNLMIQFEIFSVVNLTSEALSSQQSVGFVRIPHVDLLFSGDSTLVLECLRTKLSPSRQTHFLVIDRIRPSESLNLGHSYTYAKRHFVADIVPFDLRVETSADMFALPKMSPPSSEKPSSGNRSSFEIVAPPSDESSSDLKSIASRAYGGMVRGSGDSSDATQVFISEELSSSYCSISVAVKYMNLLQQRNQRRIHDAKLLVDDIEKKYDQIPSSPNSKTEASDIINLHTDMIRDAETRVEYYRKLYDSYVQCEDYYEVLLSMLEEGKEPGITGCLKRSTQKKDKRTEFMPTNLNSHVVRARRVSLSSSGATSKDQSTREKPFGASGDELVYAVVTHGCPAAHCLGFKEGGLRRLQQTLAQSKERDDRLLEKIEQRQDIVRCQILSIASASFLTVVGLAANKSARHQERLELMCQTGFLLNMESLLSTIKNERGMIEDMYEGVQWLNSMVSLQVVQSLEEKPKLKCAKCVAITCSEKGETVATFALPPDVYSTLPDVLRQGHALKVHAVMFTQGINEMQSVANHMLDTSLQDEINFESANRLVRYFQVYKTHVLAMRPPNPDRVKDLPDLEIEIKILAEKLNQSRKSHVQKKNVNILIESSDLCRRLGAGRTTCCKSGKDRTGMSVTLECSRLLVDKFHVKQGVHLCNAMRERGVRRVNVLANTGKNKYAFNSFQLKYLPDCYRPPALSADSKVQS